MYQQRFKDSNLASRLTLLELANLLALLERLEQSLDPSSAEGISDLAGSIEQLLANLGRPQALSRSVALRQRAAAMVPEWGKARFNSERLMVERLLQQGQLQPAYERVAALLEKTKGAKYEGIDSDLAMARFLLGRVLQMGGQAAPALELLTQAQSLFEALGERGERMASAALADQADCLADLGRLDEAAGKYEEVIDRSENLEDIRTIAVGKMQLATVRLRQGQYAEALAGYEDARTIFEALNEPAMVAGVWHQIGRVHQEAGQHEKAETAYRHSLEIETRMSNQAGQARTLLELGNLYDDNLGRLEEAVAFYRQAAGIHVELGNVRYEGMARNNIAKTLRKLARYDEAREEILRAIECKEQVGHVARPWASFAILSKIETASSNEPAARSAWVLAREAYLAYRRQGGYAQSYGGQLVEAVLGLLEEQKAEEAGQLLGQVVSESDTPDSLRRMIQAVTQVLAGSRDAALADDSALDYADAAEILWLIERLG